MWLRTRVTKMSMAAERAAAQRTRRVLPTAKLLSTSDKIYSASTMRGLRTHPHCLRHTMNSWLELRRRTHRVICRRKWRPNFPACLLNKQRTRDAQR